MADGVKPSRGEAKAFYDTYFPIVWRQMCRLGVRDADIPDLVHDVLALAYRKFDEVPPSPRGWLARVSFETVRNYRKKASHRLEMLDPDLLELAIGSTPMEEVTSEVVLEALAKMPEDQRNLLLRFHVGDETLAVLAKDLGVARSTVQLRIAAAEATFSEWVKRQLEVREGAGAGALVLLPITLAALLSQMDVARGVVADRAREAVWRRLFGTFGFAPRFVGPAKVGLGLGVGLPAVVVGMLIGYLGRDVADTRAMAAQVSGAPRQTLAVVTAKVARAMEGAGGLTAPGGQAAANVLSSAGHTSGDGHVVVDPVDREIKLLWSVRVAIRDGKLDEAVRLIEKHAREYGASSHAHERETLRRKVDALRQEVDAGGAKKGAGEGKEKANEAK